MQTLLYSTYFFDNYYQIDNVFIILCITEFYDNVHTAI